MKGVVVVVWEYGKADGVGGKGLTASTKDSNSLTNNGLRSREAAPFRWANEKR